ncbi:MAG: ABC transporter permease [Clostridia bacterium]|nr:ABC transporter permease [Clostridia bacterium]
MENNKINHISRDLFEFISKDSVLHDEKLKTKPRGFFKDALYRFKKNKSSVAGAFIIAFLILFAIVAPMISPYTLQDKNVTEVFYKKAPPFIKTIADKNIGIFDGGTNRSFNEFTFNEYKAIYEETGYNPLIKVKKITETKVIFRGQEKIERYYDVVNNFYYEIGVEYRNVTIDEFWKIQEFSIENNIQVILPYVDVADIKNISDADIWYQVSDTKGTPILDENGQFIPAYSTKVEKCGVDMTKPVKRSDKDVNGDLIYSWKKDGNIVSIRVNYYNYYKYCYEGQDPMYIFGTTEKAYCLFEAIGQGARFSLIFAVLVASINMFLGIVYGSIEGYFGGTTDMVMERISDILSGVPTMVVITLFQLHLAEKLGTYGSIISFLLAYIATGWIGMASLTRKQFYRFKGQEYVLAARTLGSSDRRLMFKHIFPNSLGTIITSCALIIPGVIGSETSLTYLGIIDLSKFSGTTLGVLMKEGQGGMQTAPHAMFFPALYFALLMIAFNLFGNGLRDAFNPSTRGED